MFDHRLLLLTPIFIKNIIYKKRHMKFWPVRSSIYISFKKISSNTVYNIICNIAYKYVVIVLFCILYIRSLLKPESTYVFWGSTILFWNFEPSIWCSLACRLKEGNIKYFYGDMFGHGVLLFTSI